MIRRIIKGIFFLAFAAGGVGFTEALWRLVSAADGSEWLSGVRLWMAVGFAAYFPIHLIFHRLIVLHVFGHELTHALWSMLFGGRMEELYVSRRQGGFTSYTRGNFIVTLAPYFFPLYAVFFLVLHLIVAESFRPYIDALLGFSISFHIMLTIFSIRRAQPDLQRAGVFFSIAFIYMMNCFAVGSVFSVAAGGDTIGFWRDGVSIYPLLWPVFLKFLRWFSSLFTRLFNYK